MFQINQYSKDLDKNPANFSPLSSLTFIERAASVYPLQTAIIYGSTRRNWSETYIRCRRLASALSKRGIQTGDTVAVMLPNIPAMYEVHFGVPMAGAVLNALNIRLDADSIASTLKPAGAKVLLTDREFSQTIRAAIMQLDNKPLIIDVDDPEFVGGEFIGDLAVCHEDGYIEIKDRSKDIIISGGENISSIEIEKTLYRHPAVLEAAVVAMPDQKWGEIPCAFVSLRDNSDPVSKQDIIAFCRDNMAHFKAPKTVVFGVLPKTSTGKIQKFILRQQAEALLA